VDVQFHLFSLWTNIIGLCYMCSLLGGYQRFAGTSWLHLQRRRSEPSGKNTERRQQIHPKRQYLSAKIRRIPGGSTLIFTVVKTSCLLMNVYNEGA
jgi:hypothetical protein